VRGGGKVHMRWGKTNSYSSAEIEKKWLPVRKKKQVKKKKNGATKDGVQEWRSKWGGGGGTEREGNVSFNRRKGKKGGGERAI